MARDLDPVRRHLIGVIRGNTTHGHVEAADAARRELTEYNLAQQIKRAVDASPPLTADQRARLSRLLSPGGV